LPGANPAKSGAGVGIGENRLMNGGDGMALLVKSIGVSIWSNRKIGELTR
jgi:hypothetical protein